MTRIRVEDRDASGGAARLLRTAVESKVRRLRLGIEATEARLRAFESRHGRTSDEAMATVTAEDLAGGDLEDVEWRGEWRMLQQLKEDLGQLEAIVVQGGPGASGRHWIITAYTTRRLASGELEWHRG